jgi:hypothetical protein
MNLEKFNIILQQLLQRHQGQNSINKTKMLVEIGKSPSTAYRREEQNNKFDIPIPNFSVEFPRKGKPYSTYEYDLYELAIFKTDKSQYWQMIEEKTKKEKQNVSKQ